MKQYIQKFTECPWGDTLYWYPELDSTNIKAKELAKAGAPEGTCVIAGGQRAGKGRMGRSFSSPAGEGLYFSLILRPNCPPQQLMHLTCAVAVAACQAVEAAAGVAPRIKWINDLVLHKKKLGGILTELAIHPVSGLVDYAIVGIGINCLQKAFPQELETIAISLAMAQKPTEPARLAAALLDALYGLPLLTDKASIMAQYKARCLTLGQPVRLIGAARVRDAMALDLDADGCLVVQLPDGTRETVSSGEVSVRGLYGYL